MTKPLTLLGPRALTRDEFRAAATKACEEVNVDWLQGTRATDRGPELTEATLEDACYKIATMQWGYGFAFFHWRKAPKSKWECGEGVTRGWFTLFAEMQRPRMRKEFVPLYEGDKLIGQLTLMRPFEAKDYLPFVERIHPDDLRTQILPPGPTDSQLVEAGTMRVQRFNLVRGRYVLEGTET